MAPVDVILPILPKIEGAFAKLKDQIGTTTAADMRLEQVKYQDKPDGITMRHTDEKNNS